MKEIKLPRDFLLGSATAATQIEGGDKNSNWYHWSLKGKIKGGASSLTAADHWNRVEEDIALMKEMNQEIYRMSLEWSRIEPEEGVWSDEGIEHYRRELTLLKEAGIEPLVTLHHFSHPQWFEDKGAWASSESVGFFIRFTSKVVEALGDLIGEYCTINEPNVFVNDTYMDGKYPPGHKDDIRSYFKASRNLILAHLEAYELIHRMREERGWQGTRVGMAIHLAWFEKGDGNPLAGLSLKLMDYSFHSLFLRGMVEGRLSFPVGSGHPRGKGLFCDFIGINYYSRHLIHSSLNPATLFGEVRVEENLPDDRLNDLGWEIYPEGLYRTVGKTFEKYGLPVYITENGIPDARDAKRARFIYDHMAQIRKLLDEGVDVRRYYHWSLLDNLEWNDGYGPRFGLIEVDYETQERRIRESGRFYGELCSGKKITLGMMDRYLPGYRT